MLPPKNHKNRQNAPKNPQDAPKTLPGYPQDALRRTKKAQDGPRRKNVDLLFILKAFLND